ncbi:MULTISPECIES: 1,2-phenylacetyl-CoA epoxidase subunit PaaD [Helcobacillus]|uniref:1,2-phenylacetyl-CoA epoxidase subunit PaaD n=1 Tax=Helcobacillus TaxID=1161125 RepID=UPI0021A8CEB2|nr:MULTISPECIES: 1,2-phenylacetyl-CoA epoxidase subunit PaaD [Helcobacillus]
MGEESMRADGAQRSDGAPHADGAQRADGRRPADARDAAVWDAAATVMDPEVPVLSIADLGVLRRAELLADGTALVTITPTYSGCPAMDAITADVHRALTTAGFERTRVELTLSPAWTTDWMSDEGKEKLREYGIAPPTGSAPVGPKGPIPVSLSVPCPRCRSLRTRELSRFASTACKALYQCSDCHEPFDYFKVH